MKFDVISMLESRKKIEGQSLTAYFTIHRITDTVNRYLQKQECSHDVGELKFYLHDMLSKGMYDMYYMVLRLMIDSIVMHKVKYNESQFVTSTFVEKSRSVVNVMCDFKIHENDTIFILLQDHSIIFPSHVLERKKSICSITDLHRFDWLR